MQTNKIVSLEGYTPKEQKSTILPINPEGGLPEVDGATKYCKYDNDWFDIQFSMNASEWSIISYILKHTYRYEDKQSPTGRQQLCRLSADEFAYGRKKHGGVRMDTGTGLSPKTVQTWINKALEDNHIYYEERLNERGRIDFWYGVTFYKRGAIQDVSTTSNLRSENNVNLSEISTTSNLRSDTTLATSNLRSIDYVKITQPIQKETIERNLIRKETITHFSLLEIENNTLAEKATQFIQKRTAQQKVTTFTDLEKFLHTMIPTKGKENVLSVLDNVVLWSWVNQRFVDIMRIVIEKEELVSMYAARKDEYAKAKKHPHYPIAENRKYTNEVTHWLPVYFEYCGPQPPKEERKPKKTPRLPFIIPEGSF